MSLKEAREKLDAPNVSDEELLLLTIMQGRQEIDAMRAAGPPKQYLGAGLPLGHLLEELSKHKSIRYVQIQRGSDEVTLANITPV
jgi:oxaloacetate decarboxylase alpha subunit